MNIMIVVRILWNVAVVIFSIVMFFICAVVIWPWCPQPKGDPDGVGQRYFAWYPVLCDLDSPWWKVWWLVWLRRRYRYTGGMDGSRHNMFERW